MEKWLMWSLACGAVCAVALLGLASAIGGSRGDSLAVVGAAPAALVGAWLGGMYGQHRDRP